MTFTVYVVWSLEDSDNVSIYLDEAEAEKEYESHGEFGCWEQKDFTIEA